MGQREITVLLRRLEGYALHGPPPARRSGILPPPSPAFLREMLKMLIDMGVAADPEASAGTQQHALWLTLRRVIDAAPPADDAVFVVRT